MIWLNGRKPPYMEGTESHALTADHIMHAVRSMSYEGVQLCAAGYLLLLDGMGKTPALITQELEEAYARGRDVWHIST